MRRGETLGKVCTDHSTRTITDYRAYLYCSCPPIAQEIRGHWPGADYTPHIVSLVDGAPDNLTAKSACSSHNEDAGLRNRRALESCAKVFRFGRISLSCFRPSGYNTTLRCSCTSVSAELHEIHDGRCHTRPSTSSRMSWYGIGRAVLAVAQQAAAQTTKILLDVL